MKQRKFLSQQSDVLFWGGYRVKHVSGIWNIGEARGVAETLEPTEVQ